MHLIKPYAVKQTHTQHRPILNLKLETLHGHNIHIQDIEIMTRVTNPELLAIQSFNFVVEALTTLKHMF